MVRSWQSSLSGYYFNDRCILMFTVHCLSLTESKNYSIRIHPDIPSSNEGKQNKISRESFKAVVQRLTLQSGALCCALNTEVPHTTCLPHLSFIHALLCQSTASLQSESRFWPSHSLPAKSFKRIKFEFTLSYIYKFCYKIGPVLKNQIEKWLPRRG